MDPNPEPSSSDIRSDIFGDIDAASTLAAATRAKISSRKMPTSSGASIAIRTWPPPDETTVTRISGPIRTLSPCRLVRTNMLIP